MPKKSKKQVQDELDHKQLKRNDLTSKLAKINRALKYHSNEFNKKEILKLRNDKKEIEKQFLEEFEND